MYTPKWQYQNSIAIVFKRLMLIEGSGGSVAPEVQCSRLTYMRGFKVIDYVCVRRDSRALVHVECGCSNYCTRTEYQRSCSISYVLR
jgi:hypothetical protein